MRLCIKEDSSNKTTIHIVKHKDPSQRLEILDENISLSVIITNHVPLLLLEIPNPKVALQRI